MFRSRSGMRLFLPILLLILLLSPLFPISALAGENLLANGDFSETEEDGLPAEWIPDAYILDTGFSLFSVHQDETGEAWAEIKNLGMNDARFSQTVEVEPETLYCFSAEILAEAEEGHGANLSIEGLYAFSEELFDTGGEWKTVTWYGETGPDQRSVTLFARLGGYSGLSKGRACFRHLRLEEVHEVPGDDIAARWFEMPTVSYALDEEDTEEETASPFLPWLLLLGAAWAAAGLLLIRSGFSGDPSGTIPRKAADSRDPGFLSRNRDRLILLALLLLSMALRVFLSVRVEGYAVDVGCFRSWGATMAAVGPARFYETTSFCDYPPLYLLVLGLNALLTQGVTDPATLNLVYRLFPNLCDLGACWLLYELIRRRKDVPERAALGFAALMMFNPATILNSAAWGQMDSVLGLLMLAVCLLAAEDRWHLALPVYVAAVLVKPQALMFGPLGLCAWTICLVRRPKLRKRALLALPLALGTGLLCVLPFQLRQPLSFLPELYQQTLSSYPYAVLNTANFAYLMGGNWASLSATAGWLPCALLSALSAGYALWQRPQSRPQRNLPWAETVMGGAFALFFLACAVFGASWSLTGYGAMAFSFGIVLSLLIRSGNSRHLAYFGALLLILIYCFGPKMHERYLFPALLLLGAAFARSKDRRMLGLLIVFSFTVFVNEGIVLDNSIRLGSASGHLLSDTVLAADILAVLNCLAALYAVRLGTDVLEGVPAPERTKTIPEGKIAEAAPLPPPDPFLRWNRRDTLIVTGITLAFAVLSLTTLGSTKAPQHPWVSSAYEEQVTFDLGPDHGDAVMLYFAQVSRYDFSVASSEDGETWSDETWAEMAEGQCFKWKYVSLSAPNGEGGRTYFSETANVVHFSGRYLRITAHQIGLKLCEVIFRNGDGERIPATVVSRTGGDPDSPLYSDPEALLDEQDTLENLPGFFGLAATSAAEPSWWNSTYFDEIYHARTAWEFIQGSVPYETSHPPLGKVLMSLSVLIFGMTPFGWRFAGALAGILMLPGIYLLAKQLTKKTWAAALACALFALDCQHLTQTQIATIDSFPVLFILFAFFFMLRFLQKDFLKTPLRRLLLPLGLSGLFMGLAIASKWIGFYAGAGLAVLFFGHAFRALRNAPEHAAGKDAALREADGTAPEGAGVSVIAAWRKRFLTLCAWCLLFFVTVPAGIYLLSYLPYMAYNKQITTIGQYIAAVWKAQIGMLNYHATPRLGMDHPFYSPWWEWPIIGKPMYFASKQYLPYPTDVSYSLFCFGNPVVWYGALPALAICLIRLCRSALFRLRFGLIASGGDCPGMLRRMAFGRPDLNPLPYLFLFVGLLAQYLPWVLVPRGTYIYHYFASVPFIILAIVLCIQDWPGLPEKMKPRIAVAFALLALAGFLIFLPYASGLAAPVSWLDIGKSILKVWY